MRRRLAAFGIVIVAVVGLSGCGATVSTEADQSAVHYQGGSFQSKIFKGCVPAAKRERGGFGDEFYTYPSSQRSFTAKNDDTAEMGAVTVISSDNQELSIPIVATFTLNTSCDKITVDGREFSGGALQYMHERLGNRYAAYWNTDLEGEARADGAPAGWVELLKFAFSSPLDTSADRIAQSYAWKALWNDPATKTALEQKLMADLQVAVDRQTGAPTVDGKQIHLFSISSILVGKPEPTNDALRSAVSQEQAAISQAQSAKAKAEADVAAAQAQVAVAQAEAAQVRAQRDALGAADWNAEQERKVKEKAIEKGINPYPAPVIVGGVGQATAK